MAAPERPKKFAGNGGAPLPGLPGKPPGRAPERAPAIEVMESTSSPERPSLPLEGLLDSKTLEVDSTTLKKLTAKGGKALEKAQEKARENALQTSHALLLMAPGVVEVMLSKSVGSTEADEAGALVEWFSEIHAKAAEWVDAWALEEEDRGWAQAALERVLAEHPLLAKASNIEDILALARTHVPPPPQPYMPVQASTCLALFEGLAAVQRAQAKQGLGRRTVTDDLERITRLLVEAGTDTVNELLDPATSGEVRVAVFSSAVAQAGRTFEVLWLAYAQTNLATWRMKTTPEQELWKKANPEGIALEPLFDQFQEAMARIRRLARAARTKT